MYELKKQIYLNLTKNQKSALCSFIRAFVKKNRDLSTEDIFNSFCADEKYYLALKCSRFEFLENIIEDELFISDTLKYIQECKKYYDYKKQQQPLLEAQKKFEKKKREFLRDVKMSKEPPTKKQLYYYDRLCKKYNIEKIELASKLEARNLIDKIITEHAPTNYFNEVEDD